MESIKELAELVEKWIVDNTEVNPARARMTVLDTLVWAEGEAALQSQSITWLLSRCTVTDYASNQWNQRKWIGQSRLTPAPPHQRRSHAIGRSQTRNGKSPRWWYIVPPALKVDSGE